jgi:uncharacterized membrane protein YraQ (UPF0718 family)
MQIFLTLIMMYCVYVVYCILTDSIFKILPKHNKGGQLGPSLAFLLYIICVVLEIKFIIRIINLLCDMI